VAERVAHDVAANAAAQWLHVDLDVLATDQVSAVDHS